MNKYLYFGEKVDDYDVRVFNEREVRASAGILFVGAIISFMNALLVGNFDFIKVFVIIFFADFFIRIFINPKYSPSMILGRIAVHNQKPEYSGAPQKKFAWLIGLLLSFVMTFVIVIFDMRGPANLIVCTLCLTFLFFESAFGICIGCTVYKLFSKKGVKLCPGGACEIKRKRKIQKISYGQIIVLVLFAASIALIANLILTT